MQSVVNNMHLDVNYYLDLFICDLSSLKFRVDFQRLRIIKLNCKLYNEINIK